MVIQVAENSLPMPTESPETEARLLSQVKAGDGRAFAELVRPHLPMLHRLASRYTLNASLAEDAVQETLVVAFGQLDKYTAGSSLKAWLASIAVRRAHTLRRGEARRRTREQTDRDDPIDSSAEALVDAAQRAREISTVLDRMPPMRRQALVLRMDAGLSHAEIARSLGTSEESVRVLVHLGLKELKAHFKEVSHA